MTPRQDITSFLNTSLSSFFSIISNYAGTLFVKRNTDISTKPYFVFLIALHLALCISVACTRYDTTRIYYSHQTIFVSSDNFKTFKSAEVKRLILHYSLEKVFFCLLYLSRVGFINVWLDQWNSWKTWLLWRSKLSLFNLLKTVCKIF